MGRNGPHGASRRRDYTNVCAPASSPGSGARRRRPEPSGCALSLGGALVEKRLGRQDSAYPDSLSRYKSDKYADVGNVKEPDDKAAVSGSARGWPRRSRPICPYDPRPDTGRFGDLLRGGSQGQSLRLVMVSRLLDPNAYRCSRTTSKVTGPVLTDNDLVLPAGGSSASWGPKAPAATRTTAGAPPSATTPSSRRPWAGWTWTAGACPWCGAEARGPPRAGSELVGVAPADSGARGQGVADLRWQHEVLARQGPAQL